MAIGMLLAALVSEQQSRMCCRESLGLLGTWERQ